MKLSPQTITQVTLFAETIILFSIILMHLVKKSTNMVGLYLTQSLVVSCLLALSAIINHSTSFFMVALVIFVVKVVVAPRFFLSLIKKHRLRFATSCYLNMPLTLAGLTAIIAVTRSSLFSPLLELNPSNKEALLLSLSAMLMALFLIINRKGALSQMIGILSLENAIVSFALHAGLEQGPGLELGIMIDIIVWILIGTVFVSMIFKKFGSVDVTEMTNLKG